MVKKNPKMRLYAFLGFNNQVFCDNYEDLIEYIKSIDIFSEFTRDICVLDYLGNVDGKSDVIRKINSEGYTLYTAIDRDGYAKYNDFERRWEYENGSIAYLYEAFRVRGIIFKDDVYAKIAQKDERAVQRMKEYVDTRRR